MITKPVKIVKWHTDEKYLDGFAYVVTAANGHGLAEMCQKGEAGRKNAEMIRDAINETLKPKIGKVKVLHWPQGFEPQI